MHRIYQLKITKEGDACSQIVLPHRRFDDDKGYIGTRVCNSTPSHLLAAVEFGLRALGSKSALEISVYEVRTNITRILVEYSPERLLLREKLLPLLVDFPLYANFDLAQLEIVV